MRVALCHYSYPPVIGGVERIMAAQARLLATAGAEVTVYCGTGGPDPSAEVRLVPLLQPDHPLCVGMAKELAEGIPGVVFAEAQRQLATYFTTEWRSYDLVLLHNVLTMPFHLAATAALWAWAEARPTARVWHWIHDLAAENPAYPEARRDGFPWELLRVAVRGVNYAAVSERRAQEYRAWTGQEATVLPNGIDPAEVLQLTPRVAALLGNLGWPGADVELLFHPARLVRRKNLELSLRIVAELRRAGRDCRLILSGPADPHQQATATYRVELEALARDLGIGASVVWAGRDGPLNDRDLASLYAAADLVLFPSAQEGFGLPVIEAALQRVPLVALDLEVLRPLAGPSTTLLPPAVTEVEAAAAAARWLDTPEARHRRKILRTYTWSGEAGRSLLRLLGFSDELSKIPLDHPPPS